MNPTHPISLCLIVILPRLMIEYTSESHPDNGTWFWFLIHRHNQHTYTIFYIKKKRNDDDEEWKERRKMNAMQYLFN